MDDNNKYKKNDLNVEAFLARDAGDKPKEWRFMKNFSKVCLSELMILD